MAAFPRNRRSDLSDESSRRVTDSIGKGCISSAVGTMIRNDEIRPLAQQQQASNKDN